jgi:hypothetical protein
MGSANPSLGAAAEAANSAASAGNRNPYSSSVDTSGAGEIASAIMRIRQAAQDDQQKQQVQGAKDKQASLKDQFETELKMRKDGYLPYSPQRPLPTNEQGQPTLMQGDGPDVAPNGRPADVDPSQLVTDHFGRNWIAPPVKPDATPEQGFTNLHTALNEGAEPVYPRIQVGADGSETPTGRYGPNVSDQSRVQQVPGTTQSIYTPTSDEKAATKLEQQGRADAAKPDKAEKFTYNHFTDDTGKVNVTRIGADGTPELWNGKDWGTMAAGTQLGPKRKDPDALTPAQIEADKDRHEARANRAEDRQGALSDKNDAAIEKLQGVADALDTKAVKPRQRADSLKRNVGAANGAMVEDPDGKGGSLVKMTPEVRTRVARAFMDAKAEADSIDKQSSMKKQEIEQRKQKFAPAGQASAATPAKSRGQLTDPAIAADYMRRAGGNKDVARKLAKADRWEF